MIPKIIHYCWISGEDNMPADIRNCIGSWKKHLPDYEFINWNDENFDWNICEFTRQCRKNEQYAFCSDYVRVWAVYNYGGFYLDSDVLVYKSFDGLLGNKEVFTDEFYADSTEAACFGAEKGNAFLGKVLEYYNRLDRGYSREECVVAPKVFDGVADAYHFKLNKLDIKDYCIHLFKGSWSHWADYAYEMVDGDVSIFICAHKPIENPIPKGSMYRIIAQNRDIKDDEHEVIYIDEDEFTKKHKRGYGEGCAMRYLYNHPELLADYVGINHYRRFFLDFIGEEDRIPFHVCKHGAIVAHPWDHTGRRENNYGAMTLDHIKEEADALVSSVREAAPEYYDTFRYVLGHRYFHALNMSFMKKEDFLEMCEMCFRVLDHYDRKQGFRNDGDVLYRILEYQRRGKWSVGDVVWQSRLQGFWLEWLTMTYYFHKFGEGRLYLSRVGIPDNDKDVRPYE